MPQSARQDRIDGPTPGSARDGATAPIRLMIVDDSIVARSILARMIAPHGAFAVVASVASAELALGRLDVEQVDIILLDVAMPGIDGITALPELIRRGRGARVLVVSSQAEQGAAACVSALALGAADTLPKPSSGGFGGRFEALLIEKLLRIASTEAAAPPPAGEHPAGPAISLRKAVAGPIECLAIGASTGGIHAISAFLSALPDSFSAPILVTQHLPPTFMSYFAAQLHTITRRPAHVAADGMRLVGGELLVAPGTAHLGLLRTATGVQVRLEQGASPSGCLPSVDPMLEAVAACFGRHGAGVVLSGMGRDGVIGAAALAAAGGDVLAQDRASSVIWGMPGAIAAAGLASVVAPPAVLAHRIAQRASVTHAGPAGWR